MRAGFFLALKRIRKYSATDQLFKIEDPIPHQRTPGQIWKTPQEKLREPLSQDGKGLKLINSVNNVPEFVRMN